ncbi:MAG: hypothetical protein GXO26_00525 [Crenarchaeota archaeon]|nr:hypothetical protein [Thermoproteota archaeon]
MKMTERIKAQVEKLETLNTEREIVEFLTILSLSLMAEEIKRELRNMAHSKLDIIISRKVIGSLCESSEIKEGDLE